MAAADLDAVVELERGSESAPHWSVEQYQRCLADLSESAMRRLAFVAELDGGFAGFAVVRMLAVGDAFPGEAELESIVVSPASRRCGVGMGLMTALLEGIREHGTRLLELEVRASNTAAIGLYGRAGMGKTGRRRAYYSDPDEDALLMSVIL